MIKKGRFNAEDPKPNIPQLTTLACGRLPLSVWVTVWVPKRWRVRLFGEADELAVGEGDEALALRADGEAPGDWGRGQGVGPEGGTVGDL